MKIFLVLLLIAIASAAQLRTDRNLPWWCGGPFNGNGYCDDEYNTAACKYDGGDCCGPNVKKYFCIQCKCISGGSTTTTITTTTASTTTTATTTDTTGCAKIPSWMKTAMAGTTGLERIIQGQQAPKPIPWQAHMRKGNPNGAFGFFCGGTILDAKTILTAAHCYYGQQPAHYFIAAGATHVQDPSAQTAWVESITLHPEYNPQTTNNDVAIVKLRTALTFNDKVQPACLPAATLIPSGIAVASGWGLVGQEPDMGTLNLMYVTKPVIPTTQCISNTKWSAWSITNKMICAGDADGGQSTCKGDSGGPLVISGTGDVATIIGTTSFGSANGCGAKGFPAVYAYTVPFLDWIKSKMG